MQDKEFLNRVKTGIDTYITSEIYEDEKIETLEEFIKWLYNQYGITYDGKS
jgi:hypothetical protein